MYVKGRDRERGGGGRPRKGGVAGGGKETEMVREQQIRQCQGDHPPTASSTKSSTRG